MRSPKLTLAGHSATRFRMKGTHMAGWRRKKSAAMVLLGSAALSGCITVNAPSEPIVIELNINITADVVYRLAEDASSTIEENADIF